jgi:putative membrane protein
MDPSILPSVNAALNATCAALLTCGYVMIRSGRREAHRAFMLGAFASSVLFLTCYVIYHAQSGSHPFPGHGIARGVYLAILLTHVVLAAVILPMVLVTLARAFGARYSRHAAIARWTLPLWLYVSVTGVVVYVMLYRMAW